MAYWSFMLFLLSLFASALTFLSNHKTKKLPPGPSPLPVIGNLLQIGNKPHKSLAELAKTHGPIMSLRLGQITTIVISSPSLARQVLQKQDQAFSNRSVPDAVKAHGFHNNSVVFSPVGDRWRSLRKILNNNLFSAASLDHNKSLRYKKVEELISFVGGRCREGAAVDIGCLAFATSINLLSNSVFSLDLTDLNEEPSAKEFQDLIWNIMLETGKANLVDQFPFLAMLDPQGIRRRMTKYFGDLLHRFGTIFDERLKLRKSSSGTTGNGDVIDMLLDITEQNSHQLDRTGILDLCLDLFIAGSDTTSGSVEWTMAELFRNPDVLAKAKAELEQVLGRGKVIDEAYLARLPYLGAIVRESWRLHPPAPFLIPRTVETDVEVSGYVVPKGTRVLVNVWAIGRDPQVWPDPDCFRPERFLDSSINVRGQDFEVIPFGAGRRICPGLSMGIRMVPVMVGSLINCFGWKIDRGLDMEDEFGLTVHKAQPLRPTPVCL